MDPLACPRCGEEMRIVAFITEPKVIDRILDHLRHTRASRRRQRAPPGRWKSAASTASAYIHTSSPRRPPLLAAVSYPAQSNADNLLGLGGVTQPRCFQRFSAFISGKHTYQTVQPISPQ